jgi:ribose/xylose/arabinose/galactoside ABC-type transport system permease subunit
MDAVVRARPSRISLVAEYGTVVILLLITAIFSAIKPGEFVTIKNGLNLLQQSAPLGLVSLGVTFLLAMRYYDLSIGYVVSLSGVVATTLFGHGFSELGGILVTIVLVGGVVGLVNGAIVTLLRVPPLVVTIGTGFMCYGAIYIITGGKAVFYGIPPHFGYWGSGTLGFVPVPVVVFGAIFALSWVGLERTAVGRYMYAIGNNETTSWLSGINVTGVKMFGFVVCSVFASVAGILLASENMVGHTTAGDRYLLLSLTAAFLGTSVFRKGEGNIWGTLVGVLILGVAYNGMTMIAMPYTLREVITGTILIVALALSSTKGRARARA